MTQSKKKIILLTTSLILTICLMAFFGVYALTILKNSTFNVGVKYEPEYLVKVEMWIDGANGGTKDKIIDDKEYVEIFNSLNPVSNGMYIDSMSNDTIHINSQTLTPIGANGDVYFKITSLENENSGKDLQCIIDCGDSTVDSGKLIVDTPTELTIETGIDASGTVTSSSLGMIKINLKFSEYILDFVDLKDLDSNSSTELSFGELGTIKHSDITGKTFYVSDINGLLKLSALVGKVNTETNEYGLDEYGSKYGYNNSSEEKKAITFKDATIQMLDNIDFKNGDNKDNFSKKFISIGNETNSFQGTFDGNDKTITGLYINQTTDNAGLFGYVSNAEDVSNAEIKNLKMQNCKVVGANYVGNFVGYANNKLTISNCSAEGTEVSGSNYVGGIVGIVYGTTTITNCYNTGSVSGSSAVGGIVGGVGFFSTTTITNCYNTGSVSGGGAGGIMGYVYGTATITNCYNTGSVIGYTYYAGGIVGFVHRYGEATITNCYNTESAGGLRYAGGIVGGVGGTATITNCYNEGSIRGASYLGGIVGIVEGTATITNCYNTESVGSNETCAGGIVGEVSSAGTITITNCYNTGSVTCSWGGVGGIVGNVEGRATITNCYYLKTSSVNASLDAVGSGTAEVGSYYGTFEENQEVVIEDGSLPTELGSSYNLKDLLNSWVNINKEENPNLKNWQDDKENLNNGYPVFAL